jgi:lipid-A-disaccharide synthase
MKYYIIAGESSGDLHASNLMKEISKKDKDAQYRCWGGDRMQEAGGDIVKHYRDLAFMGFIKVLLNIRTILANLRLCRRDIENYKPDVVILVDYPGFNLRIAKFAKNAGFRVFYYISPQVWAWKKSRVRKIKEYVDRMFVILPFEKDFYRKYGCEVDFVGHPLLDSIPGKDESPGRKAFLDNNGLDDGPFIALLPGSRKQEIHTMLNTMLKLVPDYPDHHFIIAGESSISKEFYDKIIGDTRAHVVYKQLHNLLYNAEAALVTSGTATLETALTGTPQVVCYKASALSYIIARMIVDVEHISLVNLIMEKEVVKELVQFGFTPSRLKKELDRLLYDQSYRYELQRNYAELSDRLGGSGASATAAELITKAIGS